MNYTFFDEEFTADIGFKATGATVEDMLIAAAEATMEVMVDNLDDIEETVTKKIELVTTALDMALFDLLGELIFYKDAEELLLRIKQISLTRRGENFVVTAEAYGEKIDRQKHRLSVDVKAVTLHRFKVEETPHGWSATVVLDI